MISIIIPIYNAEKYLRRAVDSIRNQTFSDWELILVDDGSSDGCGKICDEYAGMDSRIQVLHRNNQGVSASRNAGLDVASGEYIYFLDSDDYLPEQALHTLYSRMTEENADLVVAGHSRVEADGYIHCDSGNWPELKTTEEIQRAILQNRLPNFVWGKLYKKELWEGIRMPEGQVMEDLYICPSVFMKAKHIILDKTPLYFYSHENFQSIMAVSGEKYIRLRYGKFIAWKEHERIAKRYFPEEAAKCIREALYAALRARCLDAGIDVLTVQERQEIDNYLRRNVSFAGSRKNRCLSRIILGKHQFFCRLIGKITRQLVNHQQKHRQEKIRRKLEMRIKNVSDKN